MAALKLQHKQECKGLIVQIHYLKAKYEREAYLRDSLVYQKQYLLVHLSRLEKRFVLNTKLFHVRLLSIDESVKTVY